MRVYIETLGCSRNQVNSEFMLGKLVAAGHTSVRDPASAQVVDTVLEIAVMAQIPGQINQAQDYEYEIAGEIT